MRQIWHHKLEGGLGNEQNVLRRKEINNFCVMSNSEKEVDVKRTNAAFVSTATLHM